MTSKIDRKLPQRSRLGATINLFVVLLPVLIAIVVFSVEVARMYLVRSQLQTAVDSGALAAGLKLRDDPKDVDGARQAALDFVQRNRAGAFVTVPEDAITIHAGKWNANSQSFDSVSAEPDAVRVSGTLGKEPLFFGKLMGLDSFSVPRSAIAIGGGNPLDITLTLDLSGSMKSNGRIEALRNAAPTFIDVLKEVGDKDRVGVMGYGAMKSKYNPAAEGHTGVKYTSAPAELYPAKDDWCSVLEATLTLDLDFIRNNVLNYETLKADKYNGWTPIGAALRDSAHYLATNARPDVDKVVVLMSDGRANKPSGNGPGYALDMAVYASRQGVKVYTISLGNGADEDLMQRIAEVTGGQHFKAAGKDLSAELSKVFAQIAGAMKQTQLVQ